MGISRHATAHWEGDLKSGQGRLSTPESGLMQERPTGSPPASAIARASIPRN